MQNSVIYQTLAMLLLKPNTGNNLLNDFGPQTLRHICLLMCEESSVATIVSMITLRWRHNGRDGVSNHQPHNCLLNRLFRRRSKKISKFRVTGLCVENSPGMPISLTTLGNVQHLSSKNLFRHYSNHTITNWHFLPVKYACLACLSTYITRYDFV